MKFKGLLLVISLILCILFSISCVAASDVNDTVTSANEVTEDGNGDVLATSQDDLLLDSDDGTFTALQKKINNASVGDIITLERDYTYNEGFSDAGIVIAKSLTINGNGHTLNGLSNSRIFFITPGLINNNKVTLNDINLKNGNAEIYGGAILNFANLTINNCAFTNNHAGTAGGAINSLGWLNANNCIFYKNSADGSAGAMFSLSIESVNFFDEFDKDIIGENLTKAILAKLISEIDLNIKFGKEYVYNCTFTKNSANANGGALYAFTNIDITSCTFNSNKAGEKGGAVFGNMDLYITNSKFNSNTVSLYGGAVYFKCHEQSGSYINGTWTPKIVYYSNLIQGSTFTKNSASKGGAIYGFRHSDSDKIHCAKAVKCTFTDNKAQTGRDIYGGTTSNCVFNYLKLTLNTVSVKKSANKLVLTAALKKGTTLISGKQITFKFNGKTYKAKTNTKGVAKVTIGKNILKKLKVGATIKYQAKYSSLSVTKTAVVKK
ncbi:hypothetical protein [Methanobrevibacter sp.]|uniref:hypothetical protein n=1 Tax=Methanobrevibacter sp. TaxID=66852 RepID=UPI0025F5EE88|nr:hypothetical protein [Methanobrevibacter sp.]MBQ2831041.1 hypothetical protein [Methanobrevibacter sp.]